MLAAALPLSATNLLIEHLAGTIVTAVLLAAYSYSVLKFKEILGFHVTAVVSERFLHLVPDRVVPFNGTVYCTAASTEKNVEYSPLRQATCAIPPPSCCTVHAFLFLHLLRTSA